MTEVLYCPINNELFLFTGKYKLDKKSMRITICLQCNNPRKKREINVKSLKHIGWL